MSELDQLRQEAEGLRKKIRVSSNGACQIVRRLEKSVDVYASELAACYGWLSFVGGYL